MDVLWTLEQAQTLVNEIEPVVRELGYHTLLGGSVLHRGTSSDDLDLFFCPLNGYEENKSALYDALYQILGPLHPLRDSPDYHAGAPYYWTELLRGAWLGARVDIFIR